MQETRGRGNSSSFSTSALDEGNIPSLFKLSQVSGNDIYHLLSHSEGCISFSLFMVLFDSE
jgi:hypothetical protein